MLRTAALILIALGLSTGPAACKKQESSVTTAAAPSATETTTGSPSDTAAGPEGIVAPTPAPTEADKSRDIIARTGGGIPGNTGIGSSGGGALGNTVGEPAPVTDPNAPRIQPTERIGNTGIGSAGGGALGNTVGNEDVGKGGGAPGAGATTGETMAKRPGAATGATASGVDTALIGTWRELNEEEDTEATYILREDGSFHLSLVTKDEDSEDGCTKQATLDGVARTVGGQASIDVKSSAVELRECRDRKLNRGPVALTSTETERVTRLWPASYEVRGERVIMTWKDGSRSQLRRADTASPMRH